MAAPGLFLIDAKWEGDVRVTETLKTYLEEKKPKTLALFAAVQFAELEEFHKEVEALGIEIVTTLAKRKEKEGQVLGCDCYPDSFKDPIIQNADLILYIGDGMFHPKAILLAQSKEKNPKPFTIFDPVSDRMIEVSQKDIEEQITRKIRNLKMFMHAKTIGILVTTKPGQQYMKWSLQLKEEYEKQEGKKAYIFVDDTLNMGHMENYPFVDVWVNSACPRIGTDDIVNIEQPLINIREAFNPVKELEELEKKI